MSNSKSAILLHHNDVAFKRRQWYDKKNQSKANSLRDDTITKPISLNFVSPIEGMNEANQTCIRTSNFNMKLLKYICNANRRTNNRCYYVSQDIVPTRSKLNFIRKRINKNKFDNRAVACQVLKTNSIQSIDYMHNNEEFKIPLRIFLRYKSIVMPQEAEILDKLLRPKIYLDLAIRGVGYIGRVFAQLFTEACPDLVLELLHYCSYRKLEKLDIIRIFPSLWIELELKCRSGSALLYPNFEYKMNVQNHLYPGVFSFSANFLNGFQHGLINFSISFRPLHVPDESRVTFGVVTRGQSVIDILQDYGTKNGATKRDVIVVNCGRID